MILLFILLKLKKGGRQLLLSARNNMMDETKYRQRKSKTSIYRVSVRKPKRAGRWFCGAVLAGSAIETSDGSGCQSKQAVVLWSGPRLFGNRKEQ